MPSRASRIGRRPVLAATASGRTDPAVRLNPYWTHLPQIASDERGAAPLRRRRPAGCSTATSTNWSRRRRPTARSTISRLGAQARPRRVPRALDRGDAAAPMHRPRCEPSRLWPYRLRDPKRRAVAAATNGRSIPARAWVARASMSIPIGTGSRAARCSRRSRPTECTLLALPRHQYELEGQSHRLRPTDSRTDRAGWRAGPPLGSACVLGELDMSAA